MTTMEYPYACEIDISFPTALIAEQTRDVMQVDKELGDRVTKTFSLVQSDGGVKSSILRIRFEATEAKMLRVSVSSFYDYLMVSLKCFQEFDTSLR